MFFSVIIPVYNVEKYLADCLESVINQSYAELEIICINDGSTDTSGEILQQYADRDPRILLLEQANGGLSAARNAGIVKAKGDYLFLLDSDDWIEPDTLKILAEKQKGEDLVCFNSRRYFEDGGTERPDHGITEDYMKGWDYYNKYALVARNFHFVCSVLRIYKRSFLLQHQLFFKEGIYHVDNLFTPIACYYAQSVKVIPDCLYVYRIREGSITQSSNPDRLRKRITDTITIANELATFFIPIDDINKNTIYREIADGYFKCYMPDQTLINYNKINRMINYRNYKTVSIYPRHQLIYYPLKINTRLFHIFLKLEKYIKQR